MQSNNVLVIDDDEELHETIGMVLTREDFAPIPARDGESGLEMALALRPQLALVDLRLPGMSGMEVCRRLRASGTGIPIIVLSGMGDELSKVLLLEIGADDYVVKPFSPRELVARIRALLRRTVSRLEKVVRFGDVEVDLERRTVTRGSEEAKMTRAEHNLLVFFLRNAERPLTREAILKAAWGYDDYPETRTVDAHVVRLRRMLEPDPSIPRYLLTIHGVGYRFRGSQGSGDGPASSNQQDAPGARVVPS